MGVVSITTDLPGQIGGVLGGVVPRRVKIASTDSLATITAAGYLNSGLLSEFPILPTDILDVIYNYVAASNSGSYIELLPSISNGVITLVQAPNPGNVVLPVVSGHMAIFSGTGGLITGDISPAINGGNIQAGLSGTAGTLASFPATAANGSFIFKAINNSGGFNSTLSNSNIGQATVYSFPDASAATANVLVAGGALVNNNLVKASGTAGAVADAGIAAANVAQSLSSVSNNHLSFTVVSTIDFAALATAGKVNIVVHPSASAQFVVTDIKVMNSTGLSGGGGNRLLSVTDGTVVWNNAGITAALLGTPIFTLWGGTGNPVANGSTQISTAGADIYFQYAGGTTDYTAGQVTIAVTLVQVTA